MLAQHEELHCLCGFIFSGCKPNSYNFFLSVKSQGAERMSLDESTDTRKELLLGDAEALCTTGETGDLEKSQQRRGRIFYVSSQNILFTVFLNWLQSSLDVINFFSPRNSRTICPEADLSPCTKVFMGLISFQLFPGKRSDLCDPCIVDTGCLGMSKLNIFESGNKKCIVHHHDINLGLFCLLRYLAITSFCRSFPKCLAVNIDLV